MDVDGFDAAVGAGRHEAGEVVETHWRWTVGDGWGNELGFAREVVGDVLLVGRGGGVDIEIGLLLVIWLVEADDCGGALANGGITGIDPAAEVGIVEAPQSWNVLDARAEIAWIGVPVVTPANVLLANEWRHLVDSLVRDTALDARGTTRVAATRRSWSGGNWSGRRGSYWCGWRSSWCSVGWLSSRLSSWSVGWLWADKPLNVWVLRGSGRSRRGHGDEVGLGLVHDLGVVEVGGVGWHDIAGGLRSTAFASALAAALSIPEAWSSTSRSVTLDESCVRCEWRCQSGRRKKGQKSKLDE